MNYSRTFFSFTQKRELIVFKILTGGLKFIEYLVAVGLYVKTIDLS